MAWHLYGPHAHGLANNPVHSFSWLPNRRHPGLPGQCPAYPLWEKSTRSPPPQYRPHTQRRSCSCRFHPRRPEKRFVACLRGQHSVSQETSFPTWQKKTINRISVGKNAPPAQKASPLRSSPPYPCRKTGRHKTPGSPNYRGNQAAMPSLPLMHLDGHKQPTRHIVMHLPQSAYCTPDKHRTNRTKTFVQPRSCIFNVLYHRKLGLTSAFAGKK